MVLRPLLLPGEEPAGQAACAVDSTCKADLFVPVKLEYTVQLWREGQQYIAHAMPLEVASSGATPAKARAALAEAVDLFLKTAQEEGTLERVLEDAGYTRGVRGWSGPRWLKTEKAAVLVAV